MTLSPPATANPKIRVTAGVAALAVAAAGLGIPITRLADFLVLLTVVLLVCIGDIRRSWRRWAGALAAAAVSLAAANSLPVPHIEEGHNVYIPVGANERPFAEGLPAGAEQTMKAEFARAYLSGTRGASPWWQSRLFRTPGYFTDRAFALSADALWKSPKYSRAVREVNFRNQDDARIGAINSVPYNFHADTVVERRPIPFFVMVELDPSFLGGRVCWKGHILWERANGHFDILARDHRDCRPIEATDIGQRVFGLSIAPEAGLEFQVTPPLSGRAIGWIVDLVRYLSVAAIVLLLVRIGALHSLLLPFSAAFATLLTTALMRPGLLTGFRTHDPGNDGLTHESLGADIARAMVEGHWAQALQGGEQVFYFMPGLRYFRAIEDMLFGDTSFGIVLATLFLPIVLYRLLRILLPLRWSVTLIIIFLFTPLLERFGFAQFQYVREMAKGFAEPVGYMLFFGGLALIGGLYAGRNEGKVSARDDNLAPAAWAGLALAVAIAMRPNLAVPAALLLAMSGMWLLLGRRIATLASLSLGFAPVLLIGLHNWYFGGKLVPLTSAAFIPANLLTPPAVYLAALGELARTDFAGDNLARAIRHIGSWNGWSDFYRTLAFLAVVWVALRRATALPLRGLALIALSMQAPLFFYHSGGRYAYLAWVLVLIVALVTLRETWLPWLRRNRPAAMDRLSRLPVVRHLGLLILSPRWGLAYELSRLSPRMGLLEGFKLECRPLVSPLGRILGLLPAGAHVFDIGCGAGGLLHLALSRRQVATAAGFEVSDRAIAAARSLPWPADRLRVTQRRPEEGIPDLAAADVVTLCDVLHHVPPAAQGRFIADIAGRLRPGQRLVVCDIDAAKPIGRWLNQLHDLVLSRQWVAPLSGDEAQRFLQSAGLLIRTNENFRSLWYPHYLIVAEKAAQ